MWLLWQHQQVPQVDLCSFARISAWSAVSGCLAPATRVCTFQCKYTIGLFFLFSCKTLTRGNLMTPHYPTLTSVLFTSESNQSALHSPSYQPFFFFFLRSLQISIKWPGWSGLVAGGRSQTAGLSVTPPNSWNLFFFSHFVKVASMCLGLFLSCVFWIQVQNWASACN